MPLSPDLILLNARVHTFDPDQPTAEAVAIRGPRIAAVGSSQDIRTLAGVKTRIVDAEQALLLPGFNDAHVHFMAGGFSLSNINLREAQSEEDMARRVGHFVQGLPEGRWVLGGEWDHERWPGATLPSRYLLDRLTPNHPVLVYRLDGHMALANSLALELAGITQNTPPVPGGLIVRDRATGNPSGILKDAAISLVERILPERTPEEKLAAAQAATEFAARCGVTSVTDMSAGEDVGVYRQLLEKQLLKTRIYAAHSIVSWETLARTGVRAAFGGDMLRIGAVKGFADGSLGSSTALFFEPYCEDPQNRGLLFEHMLPEGVMLERVLAADRQGLQVMIHAIGDEANYRILEIYREVVRKNGPCDRRFRIEHAQHLRPNDVLRFASQHVIASVQPYHAADDGRWCAQRLGLERSRQAYSFRSLLQAGARLAFGSDWTVAPLNPLLGIKAAVTRETLDGKNPQGWIPEQRLTVDEAVKAYTQGSAYAEFTDQAKGTITPGKLADIVVLDRDIYGISPTAIDEARVVLTILGGQIVYETI